MKPVAGLHITCYCEVPQLVETDLSNEDQLEAPFSLAGFVFSLSGAYFNKYLHVSFQGCRHLAILLDQADLTKIGSGVFRPDMVIKSIDVEQVYHLDLLSSSHDRRKAKDLTGDTPFDKFSFKHDVKIG